MTATQHKFNSYTTNMPSDREIAFRKKWLDYRGKEFTEPIEEMENKRLDKDALIQIAERVMKKTGGSMELVAAGSCFYTRPALYC